MCHQRDHVLQVQLAAHICVLVTVIYYKILWVRAVGNSGILVPQGIYIHIDISVWYFVYLSVIAVNFCNIWEKNLIETSDLNLSIQKKIVRLSKWGQCPSFINRGGL